MRLQRFIAASGICSRRKAEELIVEGRVQVNGAVVTKLGTVVDPSHDQVSVDGTAIAPEKPEIYLFCKPAKVVTTMSDPEGRTCLTSFVDGLSARVFPVGRLDYDVTGLLLLTNSGEFAEQLQHPRFEVKRIYWAMVQGRASERSLQPAIQGVQLEDGPGKALSCTVVQPSKETTNLLGPLRSGCSLVEIVVTEGRNHFVKRILEHLEHPVIKLCRIGYGPYRLGSLKSGEVRRTTFRELA